MINLLEHNDPHPINSKSLQCETFSLALFYLYNQCLDHTQKRGLVYYHTPHQPTPNQRFFIFNIND